MPKNDPTPATTGRGLFASGAKVVRGGDAKSQDAVAGRTCVSDTWTMPKRLSVSWRFGLALTLEVATLFYLPVLAKWQSEMTNIAQRLAILGLALCCLVILGPVLLYGDLQNKLWAALLCLFPLLITVASIYESILGQ